MGEKLLSVKDLKVTFNNSDRHVDVVTGISFDVEEGQIVGIVGESSSGKSISMYAITRLLAKQAQITGSIIFDGEDISDPDAEQIRAFRRKMRMVFQDPMTSLNPVFSVGSQLKDAMSQMGMTAEEKTQKAIALLEMVGIPDGASRIKKYPHEFSGGQRQRIMIAMALASDPKLLIADEPTTALDVTVQAQILELIKKLSREKGMAVVLITHDMGVVAKMCDRVNVMYAGSLVESGTVDEIFYDSKHEYTRGLMRSVPNPEGGTRLVPIGGTPFNRMSMPKGCPFSPRCPEAMKICLESKAPVLEFEKEHMASCWMNMVPGTEDES